MEDELQLELEDNPGTATGTKLSVLHQMFPILGQMWLSSTDGRRVIEYLHRHEELKIVIAYLCASSLVCTSPLAVTTVVGLSKGFQLI